MWEGLRVAVRELGVCGRGSVCVGGAEHVVGG